jgi:PAS domain S-box-containing protein
MIKREGIRAATFIPLTAENRLIGKFMIYYDAPHGFTDEEMNISLNIAGQLGLGIERKRAENALRASEERMRATVEQAVAGMARSDRNGRIVFANKRFCELVGYSESELIGRNASQFTHPADMQTTAELFKQLIKHGKAFELEKRYIRKDGSVIWVSVSASPIRDAKGKAYSAVAVVVDITDRKMAETQLRRSKEMLEELVQQRTQALREANEELEDEINRRRGLEDQILEISDREQQRLAQELHDGLCQQLTAIGFMARATALRVKNHRVLEPTDMDQIASLVNQAANDARNISRALHRVDVDAAGFAQALQNLATREIWKTPCRVEIKKGFQIANNKTAIHLYGIAREAVMNANKHAQAREIVIQLSKSKGEIVLTVADDGAGLETSPQHSPGMGFHIMDYRARSIGGRLEVESSKEAGTRVSCYLPAER